MDAIYVLDISHIAMVETNCVCVWVCIMNMIVK